MTITKRASVRSKRKIMKTGNPVRPGVLQVDWAKQGSIVEVPSSKWTFTPLVIDDVFLEVEVLPVYK